MTAQVPLVQTATLRLAPGQDELAPGAAVTVSLCGHWDHDGPCRWPHHTTSRRVDASDPDRLDLRVVAIADATESDAVRAAIVEALAAGQLAGPDGAATWDLVHTAPGDLVGEEPELADRLARRRDQRRDEAVTRPPPR
jgi:hypothetical protein